MNSACELGFFVSDVRADEMISVFPPHFWGAKKIKKNMRVIVSSLRFNTVLIAQRLNSLNGLCLLLWVRLNCY